MITLPPAHGKSVICSGSAIGIVYVLAERNVLCYVLIITINEHLRKTMEERYKSDSTKAVPHNF